MSGARLSQAVAAVHAGTLSHRAAAKFAGVSLGKLQRAAFPERYAKGGAYAERKRVHSAAYYAANKGKIAERWRVYYAANKGKIAERWRVYYAANYAANRERKRAYCAAYYAANKGKIAKRRTMGHGA